MISNSFQNHPDSFQQRGRPSFGFLVVFSVLALTGCSSFGGSGKVFSDSSKGPDSRYAAWERAPQGGGYYKDDGPGTHRPVDLLKKPNAVPVIEPLAIANTQPYTVMGQSFAPQTSLDEPYVEEGHASWYGRKFHGARTAIGEIYDMYEMTAAHPTLSLPTYVKVTNLENNKSVVVRVNDRGPFLRGRIIDLSYTAALKLGYVDQGSARVRVEKYTPKMIATRNNRNTEMVSEASESIPSISTEVKPTIKLVNSVPIENRSKRTVSQAERAQINNPFRVESAVNKTEGVQVVPVGTPINTKNQEFNKTVTQERVVLNQPALNQHLQSAPVKTATQNDTPPAMTKPAAEIESESVFVQLGAFSQKDNAKRLLSQVQQQYPAYENTLNVVLESNFYRVMAGPFKSQDIVNEAVFAFSVNSKLTPLIKKNLNKPLLTPSTLGSMN